eukprot:CAMPEP_0177600628 /NCGR_PEP_ID=MMETSP0419_2-20121207/13762_1 /TAXON_ID=582737 /ORGANISM="Tetraselmis sp., Strain GSL018" /LENGTH=77 /DNA_ID=CAMNT_0019093709 /DNA_START=1566 /DNA_END=1795 /DNA_ORIENTATION=-
MAAGRAPACHGRIAVPLRLDRQALGAAADLPPAADPSCKDDGSLRDLQGDAGAEDDRAPRKQIPPARLDSAGVLQRA